MRQRRTRRPAIVAHRSNRFASRPRALALALPASATVARLIALVFAALVVLAFLAR